jgi:hypothetical protein
MDRLNTARESPPFSQSDNADKAYTTFFVNMTLIFRAYATPVGPTTLPGLFFASQDMGLQSFNCPVREAMGAVERTGQKRNAETQRRILGINQVIH